MSHGSKINNDHMEYSNVLIEQTEKGMIYKNPITCLHNYDPSKRVGTAIVREEGGKYYADIVINNDFDANGKYPAIGYSVEGSVMNLVWLGICDHPNEDLNIFPLGNTN